MSDLTARPEPGNDLEAAEATDRELVFTVLAGSPAEERYEPATTASAPARPTVRWGALVWGLLFGATAGVALWLMLDRTARLAASHWFSSLDGFTAGLYLLAAVGALIAIFGIVGLLRRGERARR